MTLKNKNVLVTGGAGFIGSHLVDRIIAREMPNKVIVLDNLFLGKMKNLEDAKANCKNLKIYTFSLCDYEKTAKMIKDEKINVVFNLAVVPLPVSLTKPKWAFDENVIMTQNLCEMAREKMFETLIHFSSSEVYGTTIYSPMNEEHPLNPHTPYAASKASCDHLVYSYYKTYGIDMAILRPFNNYGPRQNEGNYAGVIPITVKRLLSGARAIIHGDGLQTRDFIYVTDTADAAIEIYNSMSTRGKTINIASGKEVTIKRLVETIIEQLKKEKINTEIKFEKEREGDVRRLIGDVRKATALIKFKPKVEFTDGIKNTVEWYKKNLKQ